MTIRNRLGVFAAIILGASLTATLLPQSAAATADGRSRLAARLEVWMVAQMQAAEHVPQHDKPRAAQCLAKAIVADIPEADATRLADSLDGTAERDRKLELQWLTITQKDAPARNAQVMAAINKLCPDVGPYVKRML